MADSPLEQYRPWRWQDFGSGLTLVTDGGGAQVILAAGAVRQLNRSGPPTIMTRDSRSGVLRPLAVTDDAATMMAATPDLLAALVWLLRVHQDPDARGGEEDQMAVAGANIAVAAAFGATGR